MDQDTSRDQQTRAHLVRLYMELSQPQRDAMSELLCAAEAAEVVGMPAAPISPAPSEPPVGAASAETLAARHLRLGKRNPLSSLTRCACPPRSSRWVWRAENADWSQRSPIR